MRSVCAICCDPADLEIDGYHFCYDCAGHAEEDDAGKLKWHPDAKIRTQTELCCEKCFITYTELMDENEHGEALWMCLTHYCFDCCPKDIANKVEARMNRTLQ